MGRGCCTGRPQSGIRPSDGRECRDMQGCTGRQAGTDREECVAQQSNLELQAQFHDVAFFPEDTIGSDQASEEGADEANAWSEEADRIALEMQMKAAEEAARKFLTD